MGARESVVSAAIADAGADAGVCMRVEIAAAGLRKIEGVNSRAVIEYTRAGFAGAEVVLAGVGAAKSGAD